jgi:hypothetical protein
VGQFGAGLLREAGAQLQSHQHPNDDDHEQTDRHPEHHSPPGFHRGDRIQRPRDSRHLAPRRVSTRPAFSRLAYRPTRCKDRLETAWLCAMRAPKPTPPCPCRTTPLIDDSKARAAASPVQDTSHHPLHCCSDAPSVEPWSGEDDPGLASYLRIEERKLEAGGLTRARTREACRSGPPTMRPS